MAYVSKEFKKEISPAIKKVLARYKFKGTIAIKNLSTLVVNISKGPLALSDLLNRDVNHHTISYNIEYGSDEWKKFINELVDVMNGENYNKNDIMSDYFDVGYYIDINLGKWNKPYIHEA